MVDLAVTTGNGTSLNGTSYNQSSVKSSESTYTMQRSDSTYEEDSFPTYYYKPAPDDSYDSSSGVNPNGTSFGGNEVSGVYFDGDLADPQALVGAQLYGNLTDGSRALLSVAGATRGTGDDADLLYFVVYAADGLGWTPLCGYGANGEPVAAIAVPGVWDHRAGVAGGGGWSYAGGEFTFACRGSSITKCVELGYKPWVDPASSGGQVGLRGLDGAVEPGHLQACVRMLRADYCGNGLSWTRNGRMIEVWDTMAMHSREQSRWTFEAAWSPDGAECFALNRNLSVDLSLLPPCVLQKLTLLSCNDRNLDRAYRDGKYLMNSFQRLGVSLLGIGLF